MAGPHHPTTTTAPTQGRAARTTHQRWGGGCHDWSLRGIRWGQVATYQHYGGLLLFIPAVVILGVSHWTFQEAPVVRPALLYDAAISNPHKGYNTISNGVATLYNWICEAAAVLIIELLLFRRQHSLTVAITGILHQVWCCAVNFVIIVAIVEITKPFSGRLRPDFLARCHPDQLGAAAAGGGSTGLSGLRLGETAGPCTNPQLDTVRDGRMSFPSGHAANSMSVAWFTTLYVIWSLYLRSDAPYPSRMHPAVKLHGWQRVRTRLLQELWHALVYAFVLLILCLSWFIGCTRFWDNAHHVADIVGGFLVAIIFTTPFALKAIGLHHCISRAIDGPPAAPGVQLSAGGLPTTMATAPAPAGELLPGAPIPPPPVGGELGPGQMGGHVMSQQPALPGSNNGRVAVAV